MPNVFAYLGAHYHQFGGKVCWWHFGACRKLRPIGDFTEKNLSTLLGWLHWNLWLSGRKKFSWGECTGLRTINGEKWVYLNSCWENAAIPHIPDTIFLRLCPLHNGYRPEDIYWLIELPKIGISLQRLNEERSRKVTELSTICMVTDMGEVSDSAQTEPDTDTTQPMTPENVPPEISPEKKVRKLHKVPRRWMLLSKMYPPCLWYNHCLVSQPSR